MLDTDGEPRERADAGMVERTALLREHHDGDQLASWPADMHIIVRRGHPA